MNENIINPDNRTFTIEQFDADIKSMVKPSFMTHSDVLNILINDVSPIDFLETAYPEIIDLKLRLKNALSEDDKKEIVAIIRQYKITERQKYVIIIEALLECATYRQWGICKNAAFIYLFNGAYWSVLNKEILQKFLGDCAERMTMPKYNARQYSIREHLFKQFLVTGFQPMPDCNDKILVNLANGTFEINGNGKGFLRPFDKSDFLKYQLPFDYNPNAVCPIFQNYLDVSLPDKSAQNVLAEFIGCVFAPHLKLEKALILYGDGRNGKSVFFDIISALLGSQNISSYSIDALCEPSGYYRAMIANKLLNYSSEFGNKIEADRFKQLCSGEQTEARLPYGDPFLITNYAKLAFNCNTLPKDTEMTLAFFARFLIIPFSVTIPPERQDIELAKKIITNELSGVFNWVLAGLDRIIRQKGFSRCDVVQKELDRYRKESDSVEMFIEESDYQTSNHNNKPLMQLYSEYRSYCNEAGNRPCGRNTFSQRLSKKGFNVIKGAGARIVYIEHANIVNENDSPY